MTNTTIRETLERHPGLAESVVHFSRNAALRKLVPLSRAAAFHYLFSMVDRKRANHFWEGVGSGANLASSSPIYQLRERLLENRLNQAKIRSREQFALIIKAWNAVHEGTRLKRLQFRSIGEDAEVFPKISGVVPGEPTSE